MFQVAKNTLQSSFLLITLAVSSFANARLIIPEDYGYRKIQEAYRITVEHPGKVTWDFDFEYEILNENGIEAFNTYRMSFNANKEKVSNIDIKTVYQGKDFPVPSQDIEEKTMFAGNLGYDETRTLVAPLKQIRIGSRVHIKYRWSVLKGAYPGITSERVYIIPSSTIENFDMEIRFPQTLNAALHNPKGHISPHLKESTEGDVKVIRIVMKNLPGTSVHAEKRELKSVNEYNWVDISSQKTLQEGGEVAYKGYQKKLSQDLPLEWQTLFGPRPTQELSKKAAQKKLETLLEHLSENYRYFGDWRAVNGGHIPRDLAQIASSGYGDCKDFATLINKAAQTWGLESNIVLVQRGSNPWQVQTKVPNVNIYNHAIARVKIPGEDNYWYIDATNPVGQLGITPHDIAGRKALVLGANSHEVLIEESSETTNWGQAHYFFKLDPSRNLIQKVSYKTEGLEAWDMLKDLRGRSQINQQEYLRWYAGFDEEDMLRFKITKDQRRKQAPFQTDFELNVVERSGIDLSGNLKIVLVSPKHSLRGRVINVITDKRHTDLNLGWRYKSTTISEFDSSTYKKVVGTPAECKIDSPWVYLERKVEKLPNLKITDTLYNKVTRVPVESLKTNDFQELQTKIRDCFWGIRACV